ncbi:FecR family protein [Reyranella sp.]|uniref:FecR family protein n=1 Tax=Reyranella sp. TaxID=1929291 RepID=UPI0025DDB1F4|nr:FecR family protein [Reyranella sp.]
MLFRLVLIGLAVVVFARLAIAQVPALRDIPADAVEPDRSELAGARRDLLVRLSNLRQQVQAFNARCANVVKGSADAVQCQQRQSQLDGVRAVYIVDADAFNARTGSVPRLAADGQCPPGRVTLRYDSGGVQCRCDSGQFLQRGQCVSKSLADVQKDLPPIVVEEVSGDVRFSVRGAGDLPVTVAGVGRPMLANRVVTGPKSSARIRFADGSVWIVGPGSEVTFSDFPEAFNSRMRLIDLGKGMIRWASAVGTGKATVTEATGALNRQLVAMRYSNLRTPTAVAAVRGTQVMLALEDAERLSIAVVEGGIDLRVGGATSPVAMEAGSRIVLGVNGDIISITKDQPSVLENQWRARLQ